MRRSILSVLVAYALAGCAAGAPSAAAGASTPPVSLGVSNGTTLDVTIVVNGTVYAVFTASGTQRAVNMASLPPLPWIVKARTSSGRLMTSLTVKPDQIWGRHGPSGALEANNVGTDLDLSCGRLRIWVGDVTPARPPPPSPAGRPGDFAP
jgi:hypothetical protein